MNNYPYICLDCYEEISASCYDAYRHDCPFCTSSNMVELTPEVLTVTINTISDIAHRQGCADTLVRDEGKYWILTTKQAEYTLIKTDYRTLVRAIGDLLLYE